MVLLMLTSREKGIASAHETGAEGQRDRARVSRTGSKLRQEKSVLTGTSRLGSVHSMRSKQLVISDILPGLICDTIGRSTLNDGSNNRQTRKEGVFTHDSWLNPASPTGGCDFAALEMVPWVEVACMPGTESRGDGGPRRINSLGMIMDRRMMTNQCSVGCFLACRHPTQLEYYGTS